MYFDELLKDKKDFSFPPSAKTYLFSVQFKNCLLEIKTNSALIANSIRYIYRELIVNKDNKADFLPITYCYFKDSGQYIITRNGKFAYSYKNFPESVTRFDWMLMSEIVDNNRHLPIIHASSVVKNGKAVIFAGKSGTGKSSLALIMGLEGWGFIGDDIVLVDKGVNGATRAFCLGDNLARDIIGKEVPHIKGTKRGKNYLYIDPCQINIQIISSVLPVSHIIFLEKGLKENKLKQLTPAMTLQRLIENLFDTSNYFKEKLDILIDATEKASGAELIWYDIFLAIKEVKEFISSG